MTAQARHSNVHRVELASAWMEAVDRAERTNSDEDWVRADQLYRAWKRADLMARAMREDR